MRRRIVLAAMLYLGAALTAPGAAEAANSNPFCLTGHNLCVMLGAHPNYNAYTYSGIWLKDISTGTNQDYLFLMSADDSFLNAYRGHMMGVAGGLFFHVLNSGYTGIRRDGHIPEFPLDLRYRANISKTESVSSGIWYADGTTARMFTGFRFYSPNGYLLDEWGIWINNSWRFFFNGNDVAFQYGSSVWSIVIDPLVQKGTQPFEMGLADLQKIQPIQYQYNGDAGTLENGREYVGVKAEDLEKIAPFMVTEQVLERDPRIEGTEKGEEMNVKFVNPSAFQQMLVNGVKELSARHRELKKSLCSYRPDLKLCQ